MALLEHRDRGDANLTGVFHSLHGTKGTSHILVLFVSNDGSVLVDWYSSKDLLTHRNWSSKNIAFVALQTWYEFGFSSVKSQPLY